MYERNNSAPFTELAGQAHPGSSGSEGNAQLSANTERLMTEAKYSEAIRLAAENTLPSTVRAHKLFEELGTFRDSIERAADCKVKAEQIRAEINQREIRSKRLVGIFIGLSIVIAILAMLGYFLIYPLVSYNNGDYRVYINMYNVREFEIPEGVSEINDEAFLHCEGLTRITIPDSVTRIGRAAFAHCSGISELVIPEGVTYIGSDAFAFLNLTSLTLPEGLVEITDGMMMETNIEEIVIPESVGAIGDRAFYFCEKISALEIHGNVKSIGDEAFAHTDSLVSVRIFKGVNSIGKEAFAHSSMRIIFIPESVSNIAEDAFLGCEELHSIYFGGSREEWHSMGVDLPATERCIVYCNDGPITNYLPKEEEP